MSIDLEKLAIAAGMTSHLNMGAASCVSSPGCRGVTQAHLQAFAVEVAKYCAEICCAEAAMRRQGGLTYPLEPNPPFIRGSVTGATACAVRIEEAFGIANHGGPNG